jgi:nitrite reductase (cytochrome c-552)
MEHSRELQMDPEHLTKHQWFKYLKLTPKSPQIWDENRRLVPKPAAG